MNTFIFSIIILAAFLHAAWNATLKSGANTLLTTVLVAGFGSIAAALILPFAIQPAKESWAYIAGSVVLQVLYFILIGHIYRVSEMSRIYPVMRGAAPLFAAVLGTTILGETIALCAWAGVLLIGGGIASMTLTRRSASVEGIPAALLTALIIACYTLIDGEGVRLSRTPLAYTLWIMLLQGIILVGWKLVTAGSAFLCYARTYWRLGAVGGIGMMASYGLALWAMTVWPIVTVAALRETSIVFAMIISVLFLKEAMTMQKGIGALLIVLGAITLRLSA